MLGILRQPQEDSHVRMLLDKLIVVMSSVNSSLDPTEVSAPIVRAVEALARLNSYHGLEVGSENSWSGSQVPVWRQSSSSDYLLFGYPWKEGTTEDAASSEGSPYELMEKILWGPQLLTPA